MLMLCWRAHLCIDLVQLLTFAHAHAVLASSCALNSLRRRSAAIAKATNNTASDRRKSSRNVAMLLRVLRRKLLRTLNSLRRCSAGIACA